MEIGVQLRPLPLFKAREGVAGGGAGVSHAAAVDHRQIRLHFRHGAVQIVKHRASSDLSYKCGQLGTYPPKMLRPSPSHCLAVGAVK
ncbi:hypothetical protein SDC9_173194 [bioreactor metagenome]|uniref:Uncharacterized protein n=1 Tax=bioreactor metagenome TaxID=1076179 RepID=A0A645GIY8_9ZZZZ